MQNETAKYCWFTTARPLDPELCTCYIIGQNTFSETVIRIHDISIKLQLTYKLTQQFKLLYNTVHLEKWPLKREERERERERERDCSRYIPLQSFMYFISKPSWSQLFCKQCSMTVDFFLCERWNKPVYIYAVHYCKASFTISVCFSKFLGSKTKLSYYEFQC